MALRSFPATNGFGVRVKKYGSGLVRSVRWYYRVQVRENELLNSIVTAQMGPKDRAEKFRWYNLQDLVAFRKGGRRARRRTICR